MTATSKQQSNDDPEAQPFWDGLRQDQLVMQECDGCGYVRWPPAPICPECLVVEAKWRAVSPRGVVWSYAVYHRAFNPALADAIPYTVALVELEDGPQIYGRLLERGVAPAVGLPVTAVFREGGDLLEFPAWEPAAGT